MDIERRPAGLSRATREVLLHALYERPEGGVWIETEAAIAAVDLANAAYGLMLCLLAYAYAVAAPHPDKALAVHLGMGLMHAAAPLGEHAAQLPPFCDGTHARIGFRS